MLGSHLLRNIEVNTEDNKKLIILIHGHWAVNKGPAHSPQCKKLINERKENGLVRFDLCPDNLAAEVVN